MTERKNRAVMDMVSCMLKLKSMPKSFWTETIFCAIYLLNRGPIRSVPEKTFEKIWSGRRPFIGHLKVSRCIAYSHIPVRLRKKLDDKGEKCIFIGYSENFQI